MGQTIVGTEKQVTLIRMMNSVQDNLNSSNEWTIITSGSFGEGLKMRGSDVDTMEVMKCIEVCEATTIPFNHDTSYFTIETKDTPPCFTKLRLVHTVDQRLFQLCEQIGSDYYLSSSSFKQHFLCDNFPTVHGPCISDKRGMHDLAFCVHSKSWIIPAKQWIIRSTNSWPGYDITQSIVKHGILFVPIGVKGSIKEDLEWRISFSVAEKLLIYTFTHTQLSCYAVFKILLKDVIDLDIDCKGLICSYFMKTIIFWISEEISTSIWKPKNLISCFMRCFRRLIYCVEYSVCPHFFIPENNLFENKIEGLKREILIKRLIFLNSYGWQCILFSDQLSNFHKPPFDIIKNQNVVDDNSVKQFSYSIMFAGDNVPTPLKVTLQKVIHKLFSIKSSKIKNVYTYHLSKFVCNCDELSISEGISCNKSTYMQYTICMIALLMATRQDAVSGWLLLASLFYRSKQYNTAVSILKYSLLKCTPEKLYREMKLSHIHYAFFNLDFFRKMTFIKRTMWHLDCVGFNKNSLIIPNELHTEVEKMEYLIPPVVYAQYLRFLCHYHLENTDQCLDSLRDLRLTIERSYFIVDSPQKAVSYNILGISFQQLGDIKSARQAFIQSIQLDPDRDDNSAFQRLSLIS
ncbi:uncharacterized protein LOC127714793 [Mytilus californianus]|uniref:uncharacterized protein LOC127714793 n=1 Tax=Mytilus californianus TaxID=6549 RepID=UPI002246835C|nr:uncharacterized protein LOC127714793 [Mytilus californianus]